MPQTSAALVCLAEAGRKFVQFNQNAYPTIQVLSVLNRATEKAIVQSTGSLQPTWASNAIQGTYSYVNNPGTLYEIPVGVPGLTFSGGQYLEQDSVASIFATPESAVTVTCLVVPKTAGGTIWSFADATDGYYLSLSYASGSVVLKETNTHGTFSTSFAVVAGTVNVITAIRNNNTLTLRVNSGVSGTASVTAGTVVPTTFVIGALNSNGSVSSQLTGIIGKVAVYIGSADIYQVETYMLLEAGVILGASQGINSGF
jgi:hypothetical protein